MPLSTVTLLPAEIREMRDNFNGEARGLRLTEITATHNFSGYDRSLWDYWSGWDANNDVADYHDFLAHYDPTPFEVDGIRYTTRPRLVGAATFYNFRNTHGGQVFTMRHDCSSCKLEWQLNEYAFLKNGDIRCHNCGAIGGRFRSN